MLEQELSALWVYLASSPLFGLTLTLLAYLLGVRIYQWSGQNSLCHPVVIAVAALMAVLTLIDMDYQRYFDGAQFVHFLLGPATVGLAVPLAAQWSKVKRLAVPISLALLLGVSFTVVLTVVLADSMGATRPVVMSLAPKAVTTPVAMGIAEVIGGLSSLTAVLVVTTGIIGALFGPSLFRLLGIRDAATMGIAMGVAAHGVGTARAFQISEKVGAFSGLAMALSCLISAPLVPWLLSVLGY